MAELTDKEREALLNDFESVHGAKGKTTAAEEANARPIAGGTLNVANPVTSSEAGRRGFQSGLSMGFQPQIAGAISAVNPWSKSTYAQTRDEEAARNQEAWDKQAMAYGGGYAGGTALSLPVGGLALKGAGALASLGARGAGAAGNLAGQTISRTGQTISALPEAAQAAREGYQTAMGVTPTIQQPGLGSKILDATGRVVDFGGGVISGASKELGSQASKGITSISDFIKGALNQPIGIKGITPGRIGQTGAAAAGSQVNEVVLPSQQIPPPAPGQPQNNITGSKISANTPTFGTLADWLAQAKSSNNPEVQSTADQSLEALASANDPAANRLIAMNLQQSKVGRAVGNDESPVNEEDDTLA